MGAPPGYFGIPNGFPPGYQVGICCMGAEGQERDLRLILYGRGFCFHLSPKESLGRVLEICPVLFLGSGDTFLQILVFFLPCPAGIHPEILSERERIIFCYAHDWFRGTGAGRLHSLLHRSSTDSPGLQFPAQAVPENLAWPVVSLSQVLFHCYISAVPSLRYRASWYPKLQRPCGCPRQTKSEQVARYRLLEPPPSPSVFPFHFPSFSIVNLIFLVFYELIHFPSAVLSSFPCFQCITIS